MGEAVVLIPPMLCDARIYAAQIADLSRDYAVLFAPTQHDDTIERTAARILGWAPSEFALAGTGMGGLIAMEMLRQAPERVTRVALINASPQAATPQTAADWEPKIIAARAGRFDDVMNEIMDPGRLAATSDRNALLPLMQDMARVIGADAYVNQARAIQRRPDQQVVLRKIAQPALVISCDQDTENPLKRQQFIAEYIPYARHEVVAKSGFLPTIERPDWMSKLFRTWLRQPLVLR